MSRPKSAAVKDIDIDIGKGDIDPALQRTNERDQPQPVDLLAGALKMQEWKNRER